MNIPAVKHLIQCPVHGEVEPNINHIVPRSRGGKNKDNVNKNTCPNCHEPYHWLFSNLIPHEQIVYLTDRFWGGQIRWTFIAQWHYLKRWFLKRLGKDNGWPENQANWSPHSAEARLRQIMEGERRLREAMRGHKLGRGDLVLINERTKTIVRWVKKNQGETQQELFEILLDGEELGPDESIRPVVWNVLLSY